MMTVSSGLPAPAVPQDRRRKEPRMDAQTRSIKDIYTHKVGGERYQYEAEYSPGPGGMWKARGYQDGVLKGSPGGGVSDKRLEGEALRQSIVTLVEMGIEGIQGLKG